MSGCVRATPPFPSPLASCFIYTSCPYEFELQGLPLYSACCLLAKCCKEVMVNNLPFLAILIKLVVQLLNRLILVIILLATCKCM
jgi:hypothetical protein